MLKTFKFKLSGDGRPCSIGKVSYFLVPLAGIQLETQAQINVFPILVYDGKDNWEDLEKYGTELQL